MNGILVIARFGQFAVGWDFGRILDSILVQFPGSEITSDDWHALLRARRLAYIAQHADVESAQSVVDTLDHAREKEGVTKAFAIVCGTGLLKGTISKSGAIIKGAINQDAAELEAIVKMLSANQSGGNVDVRQIDFIDIDPVPK